MRLRAPVPIASALAIAITIQAMSAEPARAQTPRSVFRAVMVHGDAVPVAFLIHDEAAAGCLWFFTYNFYEKLAALPPATTTATVVLSFFTAAELPESSGDQSLAAAQVAPGRATFHTRVHLAKPDEPVHLQFRKAREGQFLSRMELHSAAEPYLARHGIPTRLDADGAPLVRRFAREEMRTARTTLDRNIGSSMPACTILAPAPGGA